MDQERWKKIKPILEDAIEAGPAGRTAFIVEACGGDDKLLTEVQELLALETDDDDLLERPAHSHLFSPNGRSKPGDQIDKYKIISELGIGGMGAVYLAERVDGNYTQKVALKVIKDGIDSTEVLNRFFNERQILASLQHDNIAHLIDGGSTSDGRPFLAMEYIEGVPITEYVSKADVGLEDRLNLFIEICSAVSFAHKSLVIHRDLKPSNILVSKDGVPKLLDFGIAKLIPNEPAEAVTVTLHFVFTPEYASPEQVRGEKLTTATDIYSLGVILYELLAGQRPYRTEGSNISQIIQVVCDADPTAPSRALTLVSDKAAARPKTNEFASELKGDLDNIVLKALRKEPDRRYSSVDQLSEDISRYLAGQPVIASSDTWQYRTGKFLRRHRVAAAGVVLVFISLVAGLVATLYEARLARSERAKAENRFNDVRQLANSFVFEINDEIEKSPIRARSLLVERAVQYLDTLASESDGDESLTTELAAAYEKIGDVQAELFKPNLGNAGAALESQNKSLQLRSGLLGRKPDDIGRMINVAKSHTKVGDILTITGDIHGAADSYSRAVELSEKAATVDGQDASVRKQLVSSYLRRGQMILRSGSLSESLQNYEKAFAINQQLILAEPTNTDLVWRQAVAHQYIGYVRMLMGDTEGANRDFEASLHTAVGLLNSDPNNLRLKRNVSSTYLWVGIGYRDSGRLAESLTHIRRSLDLQRSFLDADRENFGEINAMADCWLEVAFTQVKLSEYPAAIKAFETAIKEYSAVAESDQNDLSALVQIQLSRRAMADTLLKMNNAAGALKNYRETLAVLKDVTARDPNNLDWQYELAACRLGMGKALLALNDPLEAGASLNEAGPIFQALISKSPENVKFKRGNDETVAALAAPNKHRKSS